MSYDNGRGLGAWHGSDAAHGVRKDCAFPAVATVDYGGTVTYELVTNEHGGATSRIVHADDRISVATSVLDSEWVEPLGDDLYALDHGIGEFVYRVVGRSEDGDVAYCERVQDVTA
jgi:hypothetical protein